MADRNHDGREDAVKVVKKAPVSVPTPVAPVAVVAKPASLDAQTNALDLARRALDGTGDGVKIGQDSSRAPYVDLSDAGIGAIDSIDRQAVLLNKARQDAAAAAKAKA